MNCDQIERCKREIAAIEAEILAGNPDLQVCPWHSQTGTRVEVPRTEAHSQEEIPPREDSEQDRVA